MDLGRNYPVQSNVIRIPEKRWYTTHGSGPYVQAFEAVMLLGWVSVATNGQASASVRSGRG
jgi:hypothetical protein